MEKGGDTSRGGFSVTQKKSSLDSYVVSSMTSPSKICNMAGPASIHHNLDRPVAAHGGAAGAVGPTNSIGGSNEVLGNIYGDHVSSSRVAGGENFAETTNLQPFDIFPFSYSTIPYKSPAGGMTTSLGFPFTCAQWKELERQAMIYKYMISSVPVPLDILFPISRNFPAPPLDSNITSIHNGRFSKNGDPEPGRCKRTDGKKWRCSRDVAPNQKYCERHLHRGRPRSRKPVEAKTSNGENNKKPRLEENRSLESNSAASQDLVAANEPLLLFNAKTDLTISTPYYKGIDRELGLSKIVARDGGEQQPWQHLMEANVGLGNEGFSDYSSSAHVFNQDYVEQQQQQQLDVFSYPNFAAPEIEVPNGFIDAWSIDNLSSRNNGNVESSISLNEGDLSPSLNLSMGNSGAKYYDDHHKTNKDSIWSSPVCWELFARGGPLGEALQPGSVTVEGSNPTSPYNSINTPATTVSSPSGVLHRTMFSYSDGSVCNSPTFVAPSSEAPIQWLN